MTEFGPNDCELNKGLFDIEGFQFGVEAHVAPKVVQGQADIDLTKLQRNFAHLIETQIVICFPQLTALHSSQFSAGLGTEDYIVSTATENLHKEPAGIISQALYPDRPRSIATGIFPDELGHLIPSLYTPQNKTRLIRERGLFVTINQRPELSLLTNLTASHFRLMPPNKDLDLGAEGVLHYKGLF